MWAPNGLAIADVSITGEHPMRTLVQNAKWPAWGK
jgi:hypothetical protein